MAEGATAILDGERGNLRGNKGLPSDSMPAYQNTALEELLSITRRNTPG